MQHKTGLETGLYLYHDEENKDQIQYTCYCGARDEELPAQCKCHLPLLQIGQDEAVYFVSLLGNKAWFVDGESSLRPKDGV